MWSLSYSTYLPSIHLNTLPNFIQLSFSSSRSFLKSARERQDMAGGGKAISLSLLLVHRREIHESLPNDLLEFV